MGGGAGSTSFFALTGAPGSGKTSIVERLGADLDRVPEPAREILGEQRASGGRGTPATDPSLFVDLLLKRSIENHEASKGSDRLTLFDRGVPDCIAYAVILRVDPGPSILAAGRYRYHTDVLMLEPWEEVYTTDDERTMTFEETFDFHEAIVEAYEQASYTLFPVPRDSIETRVSFVRDFISRRSKGL